MRLKIKAPKGVQTLIVNDWGPKIHLGLLRIDPDKRNQGIGSKVIKAIQRYGKQHGKPVTLTASAEKGFHHQLIRFYKRHGFRKIKGIVQHTYLWEPN